MAEILFPERRRGGAPRRWTVPKLALLLNDIENMKRRNPNIGDVRACKLLARKPASPQHYRKARSDGLYKAVQRARAMKKDRARRVVFEWVQDQQRH